MGEVVPQREITLDGCVNFRDVGGYRTRSGATVRWRRLFRSDDLDELSARDVGVLCAEFDVRTVVDLRAEHELRGEGPLSRSGVQTVTAPFMAAGTPQEPPDGSLGLARRYEVLLGQGAAGVRSAFEAVAASPGGVVIHCAAGKDRTGLTVAAVLGAVGVVEEDIAADYALTARNLDRIGERLRRMPGYESWYRHVPRSNGEARHDTMLELLSAVRRRYGSMESMVRALGVPPATLAGACDALLGG